MVAEHGFSTGLVNATPRNPLVLFFLAFATMEAMSGSPSRTRSATSPHRHERPSDMSQAELEHEVEVLLAANQKLRAEQKKDRQKLRALESQLLLDDNNKAAWSRRRRVSGVLASVGVVMIIVGTPVSLVYVLMPGHGAYGYGLGPVMVGATMALLAVTCGALTSMSSIPLLLRGAELKYGLTRLSSNDPKSQYREVAE